MTSKRKRLLAARMCSIVASTPGFGLFWGWGSIDGITRPIAELALDAHELAHLSFASNGRVNWDEFSDSELWAEAEALLRTGRLP